MMEKISVNLYGDGRQSAVVADVIYCDRAEQCSFYQNGKCLEERALFNPGCQFGKTDSIRGYTRRAAKYDSFISRWRNDPMYNKTEPPQSLVAVMGDHLFINTGLVYVRKRRDDDDKWQKDVNGYIITNPGFGACFLFLPIEEATNELLKAIFSYRPVGLFDNDIGKQWKEERVPRILQDMKWCAPDIYDRFTSEFPEYIFAPNYVGKNVYVNSLKPGTRFTHNGQAWIYDGEYVTSEKEIGIGLYSPWCIQGSDRCVVKLKVSDKMTVKVESNDIIDENSRFM